jgi:hypothetical protein
MRVRELLREAYTAYVLDEQSRAALAKQFPPKYPEFVGHHVTVQFGVPRDTAAPPAAKIEVVGYADSGDGLEALVVSVNGSTTRPDGKVYHITWSLDRSKYKPVDSNALVMRGDWLAVDDAVVLTTPVVLN